MSERPTTSEFFECWKCHKLRHNTWKVLMKLSPPICVWCKERKP